MIITVPRLKMPIILLVLGCSPFFKITAQNVPPIAVSDSYNVGMNTTLIINATEGVLINDTDSNGTSGLVINPIPVTNPAVGTLSLSSNGSFSYSPLANYAGAISFNYQMCDDGSPNELVSHFDFSTTPITTANVGPNATSVNPDALQTGCGIRIPSGKTGGNVGLDVIVPNTTGVFDFTSFRVEINYADRESNANIVEGGNFRIYHYTGNSIGVSITVIDANTGVSTIYTRNLGGFLSGNNTYEVEYDEITGDVFYIVNGITTVFSNVAPDFSPLDVSQASNLIIGRNMDNAGNSSPSLCSFAITDTSRMCAIGTVSLNVLVSSLITNKRITYRVMN